eukprot:GHRQ01021145.1.p1 GENE.GHRQ01021145.1~~GHRQ01021145.1.p1  ORF type:complete len:200 (-),score=49.78 GHRQ01021145.1:304-903(-)
MFRPRSYTALTVQQQQLAEKLAVPGHQSPLSTEKSSNSSSPTPPAANDGYSGGKCKDISGYQRLVKSRIWLRHKLGACHSSKQLGKACLCGVLLALLMGVWALYAHTLYKVSLLLQGARASTCACKHKLWCGLPCACEEQQVSRMHAAVACARCTCYAAHQILILNHLAGLPATSPGCAGCWQHWDACACVLICSRPPQ